ncbi:hypothetical protein CROQUDRAFT_661246 [Cronartium quercuum f. sp. fusiforme G11]|uniref:Prefoldin subunit 1 n=1 Tax=Cronartium quercuum f. sp. fusiforme G11 TaxID=708437 RepID=A0A9P6NCK7_9BASI|nr:hypothetical protein CROQUDRAFT_661246 [Cronartium quercuum f. sp. fusiforme G11]
MPNGQPNDEIHNILGQLQLRSRDVGRELNKNRAEATKKARELKQAALTLSELSRLPTDDSELKVYKPVGKMFMLKPRQSIEAELRMKQKLAQEDETRLQAKIKSLEGEVEANQRALREIMRSMENEASN